MSTFLSSVIVRWLSALGGGLLLFLLFWSLALAQGAAQAFAQTGKGGNTGMKAQVWTAAVPAANNNWRASPVAVCTSTPPCGETAGFVETGYVKGGNLPNPNQLQVYVAWASVDGPVENRFPNVFLNDNQWYFFTVQSQPNKNRWAFKLDGVVVFQVPYNQINFTAGRMVGCGAEAQNANTQMSVECENMQYYHTGTWTLFNFTHTQKSAGYCVIKPQDFGAISWGPNC